MLKRQRENATQDLNSKHCQQPFLKDETNLSHTSEHRTSAIEDRLQANIVQVQHESRDAWTLLALMCFLDGTIIPEFMLRRAKQPQKVWNSSGEIQEVSVTSIGFNTDVLLLLSDDDKIEESIKRLETARLIVLEPGAYGYRSLHLDPATQLHLAQSMRDPLTWRLQALILVCHTFPMDSYVEPL